MIVAMAYMGTAKAPRIPMYSCDKHGTFPEKYAVELDSIGITEAPIKLCPMCFEDRFREAKKHSR
jgi:hypothetical protein